MNVLAVCLLAASLVGATFDDAMTERPGDIERVIRSRDMIRAAPENSLGYYGLSYGLYQMGRNEEAVAVYERLEHIPHETPEFVFSDKGVTLMRLGKFDEARRAFQQAMDIKPNFGHAHFNLAVLKIWTGGDPNEVLAHIDAADADDFDKTREYHRVYRGAALYRLKRYKEALDELDAAMIGTTADFSPFNYPANYIEALYERHYYRALVLKALGRPGEAVEEMKNIFALRQHRLEMPIPSRTSNRPTGNWPTYEDPGRFASLFHRWEAP